MKLKPLLFVIACLLLSVPQLFAQGDTSKFRDYIVSLKNDTLKCRIIERYTTGMFNSVGDISNQKFKYKILGVRGTKIMNADSVKSYFLASDTSFYVPELLPGADKPVFVEILVRGKISLFEFDTGGGTSTTMQANGSFTATSSGSSTFWYANKDGDALKLVKTLSTALTIGDKFTGSTTRKKRQTNLMDLFADNPDLVERFKVAIDGGNYSIDVIKAFVKIYNDEYAESHKSSK